MSHNHLRLLIHSELTDRQGRNPHYSLRAFARDLNVSATSLSLVLQGKRSLSQKNKLKIIENLGLSPLRATSLFEDSAKRDTSELILKDDEFRLISEWYYFAILNLCQLKDSPIDEKSIAQRLGLSTRIVSEAMERLVRLGYVAYRNGRWTRSVKKLATTNDIPSVAIRKNHEQLLDLAKRSLAMTDVELREFSAMVAAIDPKNLPKAKKIIRQFKSDLSELLEKGERKDVYALTIQLFPLTIPERDQQGVTYD